MRVRALLLSIIFMFGEVSAGGDVSKILTGAAVGIATGGIGLAMGATTAAATTAGVVAGVSTATGKGTKVGVGCDGNGNNPHVEASFKDKEGKEYTFRTDTWDKHKPNPNAYKYAEEKVRQEFEARKKYEEEHKFKEEKFDADSIDDIEDFVFWKEEGRSYSRFTSEKESYDCMMEGDKIYLSTSGSRSFGVEPYDGFDSFSTFTPDTEDGRKAVKSFIFEETPLVWHFDRRNINGRWFNHAWTDSNEDYLIPEGQEFYVTAPSWYTEKRHAEAKARRDAEAQAKINENVGRGFFEEFLWSNVKAVNSVFKDDPESGRDAINQGLSYYEYAMNAWNNPKMNCFSEQGMENIREFGASRLSGQQFTDGLWEDLLSIGLGMASGAAAGVEGGPAGMAAGAAAGGARAGLRTGAAKAFKSMALQRLQKLFESQPKYAYAGAGNSNFKNFANFRKPANNAPRNAKGSGGSGSQGPSVKEAGKAPRNASTRQDADNYINGLKGKLSQKGVTKDGYEYYKVMEKVEYKGIKFKKGDYLSRDTQHHEWEWFRGKDKHQGAIDSITGKLFEDSAVKSRALKLP